MPGLFQCFADRSGNLNGDLASRCAHGHRHPAASAVKHSVASVIACDIVDQIPMSEIGIAVSKGVRAAVVDNFRSFALEKLGRARKSLRADES